jgi:hypothetical protein
MNNPTTVEQYNALSIVKLLPLRNALPKSSNHSERPSFVRSPALSGRHLLKVSFSAHDPQRTWLGAARLDPLAPNGRFRMMNA